jgi:hypothetical protein
VIYLRTIVGEQVLAGVSFSTSKDIGHLGLFTIKVIRINIKDTSHLYLLILELDFLIIRQLS